jgi:hypothetical protein
MERVQVALVDGGGDSFRDGVVGREPHFALGRALGPGEG